MNTWERVGAKPELSRFGAYKASALSRDTFLVSLAFLVGWFVG